MLVQLLLVFASCDERVVQSDMSALGQKQTCGAISHVRFTPNSDRDSGLRQTVMSALPRKRTCAMRLRREDIAGNPNKNYMRGVPKVSSISHVFDTVLPNLLRGLPLLLTPPATARELQ